MKILCAIIFLCASLTACVQPAPVVTTIPRDTLTVSFAKWHKNAPSALSMTFDHTWSRMVPWENVVPTIVADSALPVDYDYTSEHYWSIYQKRNAIDTLHKRLGIAFFAHGHRHINNDELTYEEAKANFLECKDSMMAIGFKPLIYAYPAGYGYKASTQKAAQDAGFLAARMFDPLESPYIIPQEQSKPDWYRLPTLMMFRKEFQNSVSFLKDNTTIINNTAQLIPHLKQNTALRSWLILTYHMIGPTDNENTYEVRDLLTDIAAIRAEKPWLVRMEDAVVYLREKEAAKLTLEHRHNSAGKLERVILQLDDNLPDDVYSQPLTLLLQTPLQWKGKRLRAFAENDAMLRQLLEPAQEAHMLTVKPDGKRYVVIAE
ncbi:MAG: hypothetical protein MUF71_00800 [Candidatus Kapabacteria bacterium]|nr:hypothetical protein [Candidatus Kapabacteria bacterium]